MWVWTDAVILPCGSQVKIDVKTNEWFGEFYDMIPKSSATPNAITIGEYWASLFSFIYLAGIYMLLLQSQLVFLQHIFFLDGVQQW